MIFTLQLLNSQLLPMSPNRRIFLNIVAICGWSLDALVIGLFCGRWALMALGEVDYGLMKVDSLEL